MLKSCFEGEVDTQAKKEGTLSLFIFHDVVLEDCEYGSMSLLF